jgi:GTPase Era involved in 16S rRNA processing
MLDILEYQQQVLLEVPGIDLTANRSEAAVREIWSHRIPGADIVGISAQTGQGIDNLVDKIVLSLPNVSFHA